MPTKKRIVSAIDVGFENLAICENRGNEKIKAALSSIHITSDLRMFEYAECQVVPLCWEWVFTFKDYWQRSKLIYIENQLCFSNRVKERACWLIHFSLYSIFLTLYQSDKKKYPKPITGSAKEWKKFVGVEIGTNNHSQNKKNGIAACQEKFGKELIERFRKDYPKKIDDLCEATLQTLPLIDKFEELLTPEFPSQHVRTPTETRIPASKRMRELPSMDDPPADGRLTPPEMRRVYEEFKDERKKGKILRQNDRILKQSATTTTSSSSSSVISSSSGKRG